MAVVADASALALDSLVDAAFAGKLADVEKEFAKASIAGTNRPRSSARRCVKSNGCMRCVSTVESGTSVSHRGEASRNSLPPQAADRSGVEGVDIRAARESDGDAGRSLARRTHAIELAETIAQRALMQIARGARTGVGEARGREALTTSWPGLSRPSRLVDRLRIVRQ